jgi:hypothetical protein
LNTSPDSLTIAARFSGPPSSGNGGYTAGLLAEQTVAGPDSPVTVTLRRPPPLDSPLRLRPTAGGKAGMTLLDREAVVAEGGPGTFVHDCVEPVSLQVARDAQAAYRGLVNHPFPTCFVCGPDRAPGDGLRLAPGLLAGAAGRTACVWTPDRSLGGADGMVAPHFVWAALDCPGGWTSDLDARPLVLGRITAESTAPVSVEKPYVVVARLVGEAGRKVSTASALYDAGGQILGRAEHIWIAVDPAQFR